MKWIAWNPRSSAMRALSLMLGQRLSAWRKSAPKRMGRAGVEVMRSAVYTVATHASRTSRLTELLATHTERRFESRVQRDANGDVCFKCRDQRGARFRNTTMSARPRG